MSIKTTDPCQDDDVDTDDDILYNAKSTCILDLRNAIKVVSKPDGTLNIPMLQNASIKQRVSHPEYYDRNGKIMPDLFEGDKGRESLAMYMAEMYNKDYFHKYSCQTRL